MRLYYPSAPLAYALRSNACIEDAIRPVRDEYSECHTNERIAANNNTTNILEAVNDEVMDVRGGTEDTSVMVRGHHET